MTASFITTLLDILTSTLTRIAPLVEEGGAALGASDAAQIHDALTKAEAATATLRGQVDAALAEAAKR
jgi:hypothetical protein